MIELLVYIALFGILSLLIGRQFKALINNYADGKLVSKQQSDSRDIVAILARDIRSTGLKVYLQNTGTDSYTRQTAAGVVITDPSDKASFVHTQGDPCDNLTFKKATINSAGGLLAVETIRYYLSGTNLMRDYSTVAVPAVVTITIAENVYALQFQYGIYASTTALFDQTPLTTPFTNWKLTNLSGTKPDTTNGASTVALTFSAAATGYLKYMTSFSITANQKYSVLLQISPSNGFPNRLDSLRFSFKNGSNIVLGSEKFKPYSGDIRLTIPVSATATAYAVLDYYAAGSGSLVLNGIEAQCSELDAYSWTYNPTIAEKLNVRAIRVYLLTRTSGRVNTKVSSPIMVGEVSVARSGDYSWRLCEEMIEIPNNGVF